MPSRWILVEGKVPVSVLAEVVSALQFLYNVTLGKPWPVKPLAVQRIRLDRNNAPGSYGTKPVARKKPNPWGLYDMNGSVWEWCPDWYGTYPKGQVTDPQGPPEGEGRVLRGGAWNQALGWARSGGWRNSPRPETRYLPPVHSGFRVVLELP